MSHPGSINIIGGKYRGKKLPVPKAEGLRPTPNRVRETLFNWLQSDIIGAHTLDLFAGSGLLSFEAVSRGASKAIMVEKNRQVYKSLLKSAEYFQEASIDIIHGDALHYLNNTSLSAISLIFLDPPFHSTLLQQCLAHLANKVVPGTLIYIETDQTDLELPLKGEIIKQKQIAGVTVSLFEIA